MRIRKPIAAKWLPHIRALERLLAAGTAGAFFFALARNLPVHWAERCWPPDVSSTIDRFLRYGYLLWFLAYLLTASVDRDQNTKPRSVPDIGFDIVQSVLALASAYFLGFVIPQSHQTGQTGFVVANFAILLICIISRWLFGDTEHDDNFQKTINSMRVRGAVVSFLALVLSFATGLLLHITTGNRRPVCPFCVLGMILLAVLLIVTWLILLRYINARAGQLQKTAAWYEEYGTVTTAETNAEATVNLTQEFQETVDTAARDYLVFLTAQNADTMPSVVERGDKSFKVKSTPPKTAIVAYRVMGNRKK